MHGPLIEKYSYIEEPFFIPSTADEVAALLPGNTQYEDIDDLLITIGKQHDRATLHSFFSKLFKVPLRLLVDTEEDRKSVIPQSVVDAVHESRRRAKDAAAAAAIAQSSSPDEFDDDDDIDMKWPKPASSSTTAQKAASNTFDGNMEYADLEHGKFVNIFKLAMFLILLLTSCSQIMKCARIVYQFLVMKLLGRNLRIPWIRRRKYIESDVLMHCVPSTALWLKTKDLQQAFSISSELIALPCVEARRCLIRRRC
jgi:hypothetical protein